MKIEVNEVNEVISKEVYVSKLEDIGNNVLFIDSHGAVGVLVKDLYDKDMVAWFDEGELYVFPTRTIGFPVKLIKNKTVTLTF